ncbi:hypothetical protein EW146_g4151 [Bondarzewia mesenterica]|uniref:Uncharacterized protein n=1 Tax=Bondarzewia mesenterica TaxID=1095465 RepID=A0A4S4LVE9_9AGAM|nr:hypothetical protein EW146_g4151 [Bondarzewia mesenterica]
MILSTVLRGRVLGQREASDVYFWAFSKIHPNAMGILVFIVAFTEHRDPRAIDTGVYAKLRSSGSISSNGSKSYARGDLQSGPVPPTPSRTPFEFGWRRRPNRKPTGLMDPYAVPRAQSRQLLPTSQFNSSLYKRQRPHRQLRTPVSFPRIVSPCLSIRLAPPSLFSLNR